MVMDNSAVDFYRLMKFPFIANLAKALFCLFRRGFPGVPSGKEPTCQCRRCKRRGFDPWAWEIPWRRAWQRSPVFLPGESHRQRSLEGYNPWGRKESDTTEPESTHKHLSDTVLSIYLYLGVLDTGSIVIVELEFQLPSSVLFFSQALY